MEREIINSESILSFGYDSTIGILEIEFRKGGVYQYPDFPEILWNEFYNSESRGRFFINNVKGRFKEIKVG